MDNTFVPYGKVGLQSYLCKTESIGCLLRIYLDTLDSKNDTQEWKPLSLTSRGTQSSCKSTEMYNACVIYVTYHKVYLYRYLLKINK